MGVSIVLVFGYESVALGPRGGSLLDQVHAVGEAATQEIRAELLATHPNLQIEIEMMQDRPVDALVNVAEARRAEFIAVGHGGAGPLKAALLGSVTYEMVHRAPIPVLVVPDDQADLT